MQIRADDIAIHAFTPSDGSESAAIKVVHRHTRKEVINNSTPAQRTNLRHALLELVKEMNPSPEQIRPPMFLLFDRVRVNLPQSFHDGQVNDQTWDYKRSEWKYFVECSESKVTNWYVGADLDLLDD